MIVRKILDDDTTIAYTLSEDGKLLSPIMKSHLIGRIIAEHYRDSTTLLYSDDIKADGLLVSNMGIETVLLIVNEKSLEKILNSEWNELYQLMDKGNMAHQTEKIPRLNRSLISTVRPMY